MAITETDTTSEPTEAEAGAAPLPQPTGLAALFGTGDHKALGRLYIVISLLFGVGALALTALARLHDVGDNDLLAGDTAFQVASLGQLGLVLLFVVPLFLGLGTYLAPLQVGAATIAFPRAAALAFWGWLAGGATMVAAWFVDGGPGGGTERAVDLSFLALIMVAVSLLLGTVCLLTTIVALRTEGMTLDRVPMFSWGMLVAGTAWLLTLPVLVANTFLVYLDHHNGQVWVGADGAQQWPQLFWVALLPQVYVVAVPLLGAMGDLVPSFARVRQNHRGVVLVAIGAFGALAMGAWAQPAQGGAVWTEALFVGVNIAIVLPVLACLGAWATATLRGSSSASTPTALGIVGVLVLLLAALAGALFAVEPLQTQEVLIPSQGVPVGALGQSNLVIGAAVAGALAALFFWGPKITGRMLADGLGKLAAPVVLLGAVAWGVAPMVQAFSAKYTGLDDAADALTWASVAGAVLVAGGVLLGLLALAGATRGDHAEDDAWGVGQGLEWATACPPPTGNFGALEPVRSPEPLMDLAGDDDKEAS